jgi:hypothetical protein
VTWPQDLEVLFHWNDETGSGRRVKNYADGAFEKGQPQQPRAPAKPSNEDNRKRAFITLHLMEFSPMKI